MMNSNIIMKSSLICVLLLSVILNTAGQGAYIPPEKPRLVIGIVVEQLKFDQLEKYKDKLGDNGIRKLINEGTYFKNASFEYHAYAISSGTCNYSNWF